MINNLQALDNRELAIGIWMALFLFFGLFHARVRASLFDVAEAAAARPLIAVFVIIVAYYTAVTAALWFVHAWTFKQFKISVLWVIFSGLPAVAEVARIRDDPQHLRKVAISLFKLVVLLEFFVNLFKLPLLAELALFPVTVLLGLLIGLAEKSDEYRHVRQFLTTIAVLIGMSLFLFSAYKVFCDSRSVMNIDSLREFGLPIAYGIVSIPLMLLLATYSAYEDVFVRLQFVIRDKSLHGFTKRRLFASFFFDFKAVTKWFHSAWSITLESRADIVRSIEVIKSPDRAP